MCVYEGPCVTLRDHRPYPIRDTEEAQEQVTGSFYVRMRFIHSLKN